LAPRYQRNVTGDDVTVQRHVISRPPEAEANQWQERTPTATVETTADVVTTRAAAKLLVVWMTAAVVLFEGEDDIIVTSVFSLASEDIGVVLLLTEGALAGVDVLLVPLEDFDMVDEMAASVAIEDVAIIVTNVLVLKQSVIRYKVL